MSLSSFPSLDLIIGPMYSNKTTELIRRANIYHDLGLKVLYINSILDTRDDRAFSTHNRTLGNISFDSIKAKKLSECDISKYDVIALDESQFFPDLKENVLSWVEKEKKIVLVAGLSGDFRRENFGQIIDLVPLSDSVTKLYSFCSTCIIKKEMKQAHFTKRIVRDENDILIGGKECYIPVCRECYLK